MSSEVQQKNTYQGEDEQDINLIEYAQKLWEKRIFILKGAGIAALIGLFIAFSIPKEFTTNVKLTTEKSDRRSSSSLGAIAAMAGVNLSSSTANAITEEIYPDIVKSTPFVINLFNVKVRSIDGEIQTTVFDYLDKNYSKPWWSVIKSTVFSIPSRIIRLFKKKDNKKPEFNPFNLTEKERKITGILKENIQVDVDLKTSLIDLSVTMQDPLVSALLTDTILKNLQKYITDYKTNKARNDEKFSLKLYNEYKTKYLTAQENYANFTDKNQNIFSHGLRAEQERLRNEMNLAYQTYSQASQQLQAARAKVQESTPAYMVIQPPMVPNKPSKPRKMIILLGFIFFGVAGCMAWVLFKDQVIEWKNQIISPQPKEN